MAEWYENVTATVERLSAATGAFATVASNVGGMLEPVTASPGPGPAPFSAETYDSDVTDLFYCAASVDIRANDRLTIEGSTYRARRPRKYRGGDMAHQVVPLAAYTPGA